MHCSKSCETKITMEQKWIIKDDFGNVCFFGKEFDTFEDGWEFLYETFPTIEKPDGTTDEREDELGSYWVELKK